MPTDAEKFAPYAPLAPVIALIRRRREKAWPDVLNAEKLAQMSITEGTINRVLQTLRFLNLIDEDGHPTEWPARIARAKEQEYQRILAEIIKAAYHEVFTIIDDPDQATDIELNDAFRVYHPETQRSRMLILFRGLCQEAGLIKGGPPTISTRGRATSPSKSSPSSSNGAKRPQSHPKDTPFDTGPEHISPMQANQPVTETPTMSTEEYAIMRGVLNKLPFTEKRWTQAERTKWLKAVEAVVDMLFELEDPHPGGETEETMFQS